MPLDVSGCDVEKNRNPAAGLENTRGVVIAVYPGGPSPGISLFIRKSTNTLTLGTR